MSSQADERLIRKQNRREKRLKRFKQSREQTLKNPACHNCIWLLKPFGQSPCKSCRRFDPSRKHDKFKAKKK